MAEPRTLKRLVIAALAFWIAWQAQGRLAGPIKSDGWILYGIAIALFVAAFARQPSPLRPSPKLGEGLGVRPADWPGLNPIRRGLLGLALLSLLVSVVQTASAPSDSINWTFHILSVLFFAAAFTPALPIQQAGLYVRRWASSAQRPSRAQVQALVVRSTPFLLVLALGFFMRVWQIDQFPFGTWFDEADNGLYAVRMLNDPAFRPVYVESTNLPAHFLYLIALSFKLFGVSTTSMRFVTIAFGMITVIFAYLLFRRWLGECGGLVAAALFAVLRYDLNFSRIALHGITTPAFEMVVLYFLDRALERKRLSDFAWTGLALGFGLAFYAPFRLFPFVLTAFVGGLLIGVLRRRSGRSVMAQLAPHGAVLLIGAFIAIAPMAQFAVQHRDVFFARTNTVSIFEKRDEPDLMRALWSNTVKHLEMFNVHGDRNGRHNLPGEPMLDPIMGALAVLGIGYALWRWRDPANGLMLLVFGVMLLGGILTLDFEAPQSLRAIGVMPSLVYFAALPLALVMAEARRVFARTVGAHGRAPLPASALALVAVLAVITWANFDTFFNKQRNSSEVWAAYSAAETIAAREMARLADNDDLIVSTLFADHPTVRFIAPGVTNYQQWTASEHLPLVRDGTRGAALLLDPLLLTTYNEARRIYPAASFQEYKPPSGAAPAVYEVRLTPNDLRSVQGLLVRYYKGVNFDGASAKEEAVGQLAVDWTKTPPVSGAFSAEFRGVLSVPQYGSYRFSVRAAVSGAEASPAPTLWVDEDMVGDAPLSLARGNHALRLRAVGGAGKVELWWQTPGTGALQLVPASALFRPAVSNSGLLGAYYRSANWSGDAAFTQVDPQIAFYFHNLPLPRPYSVEWKGKIYAPRAGQYRFATESVDESQVSIDSQMVVNNQGRGATIEGLSTLTLGWHDIVIRFADKTSYTHLYFYWSPPGGGREVVPARYLAPPMGKYPTAEEIAALAAPPPIRPPSATPAAQSPGLPSQAAGGLNLTFVQTIGVEGEGPAGYKEPRAIGVGLDGRLYVVDSAAKRVQMLDADGKLLGAIEGGEEKFVEPFDLVTTSTGAVVVLDSESGWIYRFDSDGKPLGRFAGPSAQFFHPRGLSIDAFDNLYVADTGGSRIVKLSPEGQVLRVFGTKGNSKGQLVEPSDGAADRDGFLFATDTPNKRIEVFGPDGRYLLDFPIPNAGPFNGPHIAFAPDGTLLVTAPEPHKIQRYTREGKLLGEWGGFGSQPGQFRLPTGITVAGDFVWIADTGNHRIQKWKIETGP